MRGAAEAAIDEVEVKGAEAPIDYLKGRRSKNLRGFRFAPASPVLLPWNAVVDVPERWGLRPRLDLSLMFLRRAREARWLSLALSCVFESLSRVAPRVLRWGVSPSHGNVTEQ